MIKAEAMKPLGHALMDYIAGEKEAALTLGREDGEVSSFPIAIFFREATLFPLEKVGLENCRGRVLDVGAGAGVHSLYLQNQGFDVYALDILPEACKVMRDRGVREVFYGNTYEFQGVLFDTLLIMGRSIGNVETLAGLDDFLADVRRLVKPGGQIILNSADVQITDNPRHLAYHEFARRSGRYIGEIRMYLEYKGIKGPMTGYLHVDAETLAEHAKTAGWSCDILFEGDEGNYLARLTKEDTA